MKIWLFCVFTLLNVGIHAQQKDIVIEKDLALNSHKLKVKMGAQWMGKIMKIKFGEYAVTDSKNGWVKTKSNSKLFSPEVTSEQNHEFSFVLEHKSKEKATVNVATSISTEELRQMTYFSFFSVGSDRFLSGSQNYSAIISTGSNDEHVWVLVMSIEEKEKTGKEFRAFLTNQERIIDIFQTSSNREGEDTRLLPALGYEFLENDQSLAAMQYYGGGTFGLNKSFVWLRSELTQSDQLVLAAAMTALFQVEMNNVSGMD